MDGRRFDGTVPGHEEITQGRKTLRGKLRTALFLVEASKSADEIQAQVERIGAPADSLAQLEAGGYIPQVGNPKAGETPPIAAAPSATGLASPDAMSSSW